MAISFDIPDKITQELQMTKPWPAGSCGPQRANSMKTNTPARQSLST